MSCFVSEGQDGVPIFRNITAALFHIKQALAYVNNESTFPRMYESLY